MDPNVEIEARFVNQALLDKCNDLFGQILGLNAYVYKLQDQVKNLEMAMVELKSSRSAPVEGEVADVRSVN